MSDSTLSYFKSVPDELLVQRAKTAIATVASSGIELELAKKLSLNRYRVVAKVSGLVFFPQRSRAFLIACSIDASSPSFPANMST